MAQAAKHLRKNKDLEAQLEQERKEKEEERNKKRSRSRDKKRKVLGLFTATEYESSRPVSLHRARLAVNQSDADAVDTVLWTETQYSFHFHSEGSGAERL
ncbi:hypothetical protein PFLUV_G00070620 [Perca fluviatilis]|uniref:Uncharacterized protein n=1 Tax=Perca fluviatilis TaxID=8168 RepID=A0A6A5FE28_PERFL|nr:hypothetical protein PFLUV_G00070620 [Perca fluviatilis]